MVTYFYDLIFTYAKLPQATKRQLFATILSIRVLWQFFKVRNIEKATIRIFIFICLLKFFVEIIWKIWVKFCNDVAFSFPFFLFFFFKKRFSQFFFLFTRVMSKFFFKKSFLKLLWFIYNYIKKKKKKRKKKTYNSETIFYVTSQG